MCSHSRRGTTGFADIAAAVLLFAATRGGGRKAAQAVEVYPSLRFTPWGSDKLPNSTRHDARTILHYLSPRSWDNVGTNSLEQLSYESISLHSSEQAEAISRLMEEPEDSWDCYLSHYEDYTWKELELNGVQDSFIVFGYDQRSWQNDKIPRPEVENQDWSNLTETERLAAEDICYFEALWDEEPLPEWEEHEELDPDHQSDADNDEGGDSQTTIVAAAVVGVAVILAIVCWYVQRRRGKDPSDDDDDGFGTLRLPTRAPGAVPARDDGISTLETPTEVREDGALHRDEKTDSVSMRIVGGQGPRDPSANDAGSGTHTSSTAERQSYNSCSEDDADVDTTASLSLEEQLETYDEFSI